MASGRPSLQKPPLVEMILGVQFDRVRGMTNGHLGAFWKKEYPDWPAAEDLPPLEPQWESFDAAGAWGPKALQLKLSQDPRSRLRIRGSQGDRLIQVQNGRIHYNWLKKPGNEYPRYGKELQPAFLDTYGKLGKYVSEEFGQEIRPDQWEITYINHLIEGECWNVLSDCARLFRDLGAVFTGPGGRAVESLSAEWHFEIPPQAGRLHVDLSTGLLERPGDKGAKAPAKQAVVLNLTARGGLPEGGVTAGLDRGHQEIVGAFFGLISDEARTLWGYEHGNA